MKVGLTILCLIFGTLAFAEEAKFSNPPSNLPIKKIFVHGRPVYVRQSFVNPIRYLHGFESSKSHSRKKRCFGIFAGLFGPPPSFGYGGGSQSPVASVPQFSGGYDSNPTPPVAPQGYESPVPDYSQQQPSFQNLPVQEQGAQGNLNQGSLNAHIDTPPAPPPTPPPPPPAPVGPKYPLPECYTNKDGFMCCNHELEDIMDKAYDELKASRDGKWSNCNIQQIANKVSGLAEARFNTTFETLAGVGDYASKSHFYHNLICKIERDNRFILAYASPRKDKLPGDDFLTGGSQTGDNGPAPYKAAHHTWRL